MLPSRHNIILILCFIFPVTILLSSQTLFFVLLEEQANTICCASFWKAAQPTPPNLSPLSYFLLFSSGNCLGLPSQIRAHPGVASRGYLR